MPAKFEAVFGSPPDGRERYSLSVAVGQVVLDCYFFTPDEIEFSFAPDYVTEHSLRGLLAFMIEIREATGKPVIMLPENVPQSPIFTYDPSEHQLRWSPQHEPGSDGAC